MSWKICQALLLFQSTRPRGARLVTLVMVLDAHQFQSTRPRGARHNLGNQPSLFIRVSIHAPAGGATYVPRTLVAKWKFQSTRPRGARHGGGALPGKKNGFQSTRPRGARHSHTKKGTKQVWFQSTRPRGARQVMTSLMTSLMVVSIHAPAGGATMVQKSVSRIRHCFNPRARGGRDRGLAGLGVP